MVKNTNINLTNILAEELIIWILIYIYIEIKQKPIKSYLRIKSRLV